MDKIHLMAESSIQKVVMLYDKITNDLGLDERIKDKALEIYIKAKQNKVLKGFSYPEIVAGTVFVACALESKPVLAQDLARALGIDRKIIWSIAKKLQTNRFIDKLVLSRKPEEMLKHKLKGLVSDREMHRFMKFVLGNFSKMKRKAGHVYNRTMLAALTWIASSKGVIKRKLTQQEVADIFGISTVSLRKAAKLFL